VDGQVESHIFGEVGVVETELVGEVFTVIHGTISFGDGSSIAVFVVVNEGSDSADASAEVKAIFEGRFPVLGLVNAIVVGFEEVGARLDHVNTRGELGHAVHFLGEGLDQLLFLGGEGSTLVDLFLEFGDFGLTGLFSSKE
jgi:hypothetical protein